MFLKAVQQGLKLTALFFDFFCIVLVIPETWLRRFDLKGFETRRFAFDVKDAPVKSLDVLGID